MDHDSTVDSKSWLLLANETETGPYSLRELRDLLLRNEISEESAVRHMHLEDAQWIPLKSALLELRMSTAIDEQVSVVEEITKTGLPERPEITLTDFAKPSLFEQAEDPTRSLFDATLLAKNKNVRKDPHLYEGQISFEYFRLTTEKKVALAAFGSGALILGLFIFSLNKFDNRETPISEAEHGSQNVSSIERVKNTVAPRVEVSTPSDHLRSPAASVPNNAHREAEMRAADERRRKEQEEAEREREKQIERDNQAREQAIKDQETWNQPQAGEMSAPMPFSETPGQTAADWLEQEMHNPNETLGNDSQRTPPP